MRLHQVVCPKCQATITSRTGMPPGQSLNCPKCSARFAAAAPADMADDHDDEDGEERPRRRRKGRVRETGAFEKPKANIWVYIVTLAALLSVLGVLGYLLVERLKQDRDIEAYNERIAAEDREADRRAEGLQPVIAGPGGPVGDAAMARRLAGKWVFDPASGPAPEVLFEYEFRMDGLATLSVRFEDGSHDEPVIIRWRVPDVKGDGGVFEVRMEDFTWRKYRFRLVNGDAGLIITPPDDDEAPGRYKRG